MHNREGVLKLVLKMEEAVRLKRRSRRVPSGRFEQRLRFAWGQGFLVLAQPTRWLASSLISPSTGITDSTAMFMFKH